MLSDVKYFGELDSREPFLEKQGKPCGPRNIASAFSTVTTSTTIGRTFVFPSRFPILYRRKPLPNTEYLSASRADTY